ncbi:unnamed protein product [Closterium sp. Naga37s-1]|nr:unnamed protein product [Closterium sp. Naga37s-1]
MVGEGTSGRQSTRLNASAVPHQVCIAVSVISPVAPVDGPSLQGCSRRHSTEQLPPPPLFHGRCCLCPSPPHAPAPFIVVRLVLVLSLPLRTCGFLSPSLRPRSRFTPPFSPPSSPPLPYYHEPPSLPSLLLLSVGVRPFSLLEFVLSLRWSSSFLSVGVRPFSLLEFVLSLCWSSSFLSVGVRPFSPLEFVLSLCWSSSFLSVGVRPFSPLEFVLSLRWSSSSVPQQQNLQQQQQQQQGGGGAEVQRWYLDNTELEAFLRAYVDRCSHMARLYSIGRSVLGVPLWVLLITLNPTEKRPRFTFKYIGGVHGDEPLGRQLLLYLADWLCNNYPSHPLAREVVEGVELHLLPAMNPDGFTLHTRENANRVDLNRAFPDHWFAEMNAEEAGQQAEVRAVMRWTQRHHFSASASLHGGALVASYAWDGTKDKGYRPCPPHPCAAMHRPVPPSFLSCIRFPVPSAVIDYPASPSPFLPTLPSLPPLNHRTSHFSSSSHKPISPIPTPPSSSLTPQQPPSRQPPSPPWHQSSTHYAASPDDATFRLMATTYATAHPSMALSRDFPGGITNGASWYRAQGGVAGASSMPRPCPPTPTPCLPPLCLPHPSAMPPPCLPHASPMPPPCLPHASPMPPPCLPHAPPCPDHAAMCPSSYALALPRTPSPFLVPLALPRTPRSSSYALALPRTPSPFLVCPRPSSYALALPRTPSLFLVCPRPSSHALALPRMPSPFLVCPRPSSYALALPRTPSPFLVRPRPSSYALALPRTPSPFLVRPRPSSYALALPRTSSPFLVRPRPSPYAPYRLHPLAAALLPQLWEEHRPALLALLTSTAKMGVQGTVLCAATSAPLPASIAVHGIDIQVMASKRFGDFYRLLPPGNYTVTISHPGHINHTTNVTVHSGRPTLLHVLLRPSSPPSLHAPSIFQTRSLPPPPSHPSGLAAWLPWHWGSKRGDATGKQGVRKGGGQGGRAGGADDPSLVLPSRQQAAAAAAAGGVLSSDEVMWAVGMGSSAALAAAVVAVVLLGGLLMMVGHRRRRFLFSHRGLPLRSLPKV